VENSLRRLKTDRIDLYYVHWPTTKMSLHEMMRALDDLVKSGKVVYPASSNFPAWLVMRTQWVASENGFAPLVCGQYPYNLIERGLEIEILPMAKMMNFGITIYRSIAIGVLTGKYLTQKPSGARGEQDQRIDKWMTKYRSGVEKLVEYGRKLGVSATAVANAWVASHPAITSVILGISRLEQLQQNLKESDLVLTPDQRTEISGFFNTEIQEEGGGAFPAWRRRDDLL
jgi:aryl-alcohol dehydrogenase-like predicted oxidoreductase